MRRTEGAHLTRVVGEHLDRVASLVGSVEARSPQSVDQKKIKLEARLVELLDGVSLEPARLAQEVALMVDRVDVVEELERMQAHIDHARELLKSSLPIGRKLDFLVQEMNRETNTIGAKCADVEISHAVVEMKAELERLREQTQNIE